MADSAIGFLAAMKQKLDDANAVGDRATDVKKFIDLFEVTMAMIPRRNTKDSANAPSVFQSDKPVEKIKDAEGSKEETESENKEEDPEGAEDDSNSIMGQLEAILPKGSMESLKNFGSFSIAASSAASKITALVQAGDLEKTASNESQSFIYCVVSSIKPKKVKRSTTSGQQLLEMKNKETVSDLEITFMGINCLVKSGYEEIEDAVNLVIEINNNPASIAWFLTPWKFQELIDMGQELEDHLTKVEKFIGLLNTAISVASYAVSLEQLDNTMNAANAIESDSFKKFWRKRIGTTVSRVPVDLFADTYMTTKMETLIKYHRKELRYWTEEIEDSPETPDIIYRRCMFSRFHLPAGADMLSVYSINKFRDEAGQYKSMDQLFDDLKQVELSFTRRIRFKMLTYDDESEKITLDRNLQLSGVYKVKPFQRLYISCTAPVFKDEVASFDCFTILKCQDELEGLEGPDISYEEKRKYRLYVKRGVQDPVNFSEVVTKASLSPVMLPKLSPRPAGFPSSDNFGNTIKNYRQDNKDNKKQKVDKHWIHYQYSASLANSYVDKYQRMLYAPVLTDPGVYTVRYCLDGLQLNEETNREHIKNLALKSSKNYYYNREFTAGGTSVLNLLAALASPDHIEDFGNDDLHRRFVKIFLSYLKEVELKNAKWTNDSLMLEKLLSLREMIRTGNDDRKSSSTAEHTKFAGIRVFPYDTDGSQDNFKRVKTVINTDENDGLLDICNNTKSLICEPYPPAEAITEARERLAAMRQAKIEAETNGVNYTPPVFHKEGLSVQEIAHNTMNMSAAYVEDIIEEYTKNVNNATSLAYIESLKLNLIKDPAFAKSPVESISSQYVLYQRHMIDMLKFQYFFLIRDLIDDVAFAHTKAMSKSTLAGGKKFLDSQRLEKLEEWKAKKAVLQNLLNFQYECLPNDLPQEYQARHVDFKKCAMIDCTKSKAYRSGENCFVGSHNKEAYVNFLLEITDVEVKEALTYRKYLRAIELYEFKCDLLENTKSGENSRRRHTGERGVKGMPPPAMAAGGDSNAAISTTAGENTNDSAKMGSPGRGSNNGNQSDDEVIESNKINSREDIVFQTDLKIKKLKSYIKILQKHIESNFADPSGQDRSHKMKRMDDCRQLIEMLKGVMAAASLPVPEFYSFQILTHTRSKRARCPLGLMIEIERDFGLAWGEIPLLSTDNSFDLDYYLERYHVRFNATYPFAVAKELRVNIHDYTQPMKYIVLVAAADEKDEMYLRVQSMDKGSSGENNASADEGGDVEVNGRNFIRHAIIDIEPLFRKLHSLPDSMTSKTPRGPLSNPPVMPAVNNLNNSNQLTLMHPNMVAATPGSSSGHTSTEVTESNTLQLIRQLKTLRKCEERLKFKLSLIEKIQYDLDECLTWQMSLRGTLRAFVKRQYAYIMLIRGKCAKAKARPPYSNLAEKLEVKVAKFANEEYVLKHPNKTPEVAVCFDTIVARRQTFADLLYEDIENSYYDQDFETFGSDLEGIIIISRKVLEYKRLAKLQHLYLLNAGKFLKLKERDDEARKILRDRKKDKAELKEYDDVLDKYHRTIKKMMVPPNFVIFHKDIFAKDKNDKVENNGEMTKSSANGISPRTPAMVSTPASTIFDPATPVSPPTDESLSPLSPIAGAIIDDSNNNTEAIIPLPTKHMTVPKKRRGAKKLFDFIESKLNGIKDDFKEFWSECDEITKNEKNKEVFESMKSDDVIRKRHGELSFDDEAARTGQQVDADKDDGKDDDDKDDKDEANDTNNDGDNNDGDADNKSKDDDNKSVSKGSDNASETTGGLSDDVGSELGDVLQDTKADEGGQYLSVYRKLFTFIDVFTKANKQPPLIDLTTEHLIPAYLRLYNEDVLDFPVDEYYDEFETMIKLMAIFLDEISSIVYTKTTFEIKLLNSTRNVIDKSNNDASTLRIVFVEDDLVDRNYDNDDDDEGENIDGMEREGLGEDFSYLEEENNYDDAAKALAQDNESMASASTKG